MDIINSLFTSVFGMSVVFAVLVALILLIYGQTLLMKKIHRDQPSGNVPEPAKPILNQSAPVSAASATAPGKLELVGIDEKTAAMVMAIVCDESGIPVNELIFKSIREIA